MSEESEEAVKYDSHTQFWNATGKGVSRFMDIAPTTWRDDTSSSYLYRAERKIITKHLEPFYTGAFVTIFLFGTFRISGSRWFTRLRDVYSRQGTTTTSRIPSFSEKSTTPIITNNNNKQTTGDTNRWKSYLDTKAGEKSYMENDLLIQLPIDLLLSILCGISTVIWFSKPTEILNDFEVLPLIHGKSLIHTHVCPEFIVAYNTNRIISEEKENDTNDDDIILNTFHMFVQNCQIRSEYMTLRKYQSYNTPDIIPYPGLKKTTTTNKIR